MGLKEGDIVDALKTDTKFKNIVSWSKATVTSVTETDVIIQFSDEGSAYDRIISRESGEIVPEGTITT